jgi:hypothetical protein
VLTVDGRTLPPGAYFLRLAMDGAEQTLQIARVR